MSFQIDDPMSIGAGAATPLKTGRFLVLLDPADETATARTLASDTGVWLASLSEMSTADDVEEFGTGAVLEGLGVAVVNADPELGSRMMAESATGGRLRTIPEEWKFASLPDISEDYLRGYRDGVNDFSNRLVGTDQTPATAATTEAQATWGLQAIGADGARYTGRGVAIAVLDTGVDLTHPDLAGRIRGSRSFVVGEDVQDGNGHGTHVIGTVAGPVRPSTVRRYGVAIDAMIYAGKVLSNAGRGRDGDILAGIAWGIQQRCAIISMSLGARVGVGQTFNPVYEQAAQRAIGAGSLVIAAACNDSSRPFSIAPVSSPANCPSIMAVAAVDASMRVAAFSNGQMNGSGGEVDIAGPGVRVFSSYPVDRSSYATLDGTSMATPHVAGVAALYVQKDGVRGLGLRAALTSAARPLNSPARDTGAGLVTCP